MCKKRTSDQYRGYGPIAEAVVDRAHGEHGGKCPNTDTEKRQPECSVRGIDRSFYVGQHRRPSAPENTEDAERGQKADSSTVDDARSLPGSRRVCSHACLLRRAPDRYCQSMMIRTATTEDDLAAAFDVYADVAAEGVWIGAEAPVERAARLAKWNETFLGEEGSVMFLVEADAEIAGAAVLRPQGACGSGLYELGMWIGTEHRGRGAGSALVEACIKWAEQQGAHKITLQVWPHNEPARALYRKYGFEEEGYLKRHWRRRSGEIWDSVVMGRLL